MIKWLFLCVFYIFCKKAPFVIASDEVLQSNPETIRLINPMDCHVAITFHNDIKFIHKKTSLLRGFLGFHYSTIGKRGSPTFINEPSFKSNGLNSALNSPSIPNDVSILPAVAGANG